jgi:ABC-2 type transport system ATP-binding protein
MSSVVVETSNLVKRYGDTTALDGIDLNVGQGLVYGLIGPNGAGKTTLLGILSGLRTPTAGSVNVASENFAVLPDSPAFDPWLTAYEVVDLARNLAPTNVPKDAVEDVLEQAGLTEAAQRKVSGFSRGMLQRLGIAATVVGGPDLLLLDEPAAALDPAGRREVLDLVTGMRGRATVMFSSHILDDVQEVCDEIGILRRGQLVYDGPLEGLIARQSPQARYVVETRGDAAGLAHHLLSQPWVVMAAAGDSSVTLESESLRAAEANLAGVLGDFGQPIVSMSPLTRSLEEIFLEVTE